MKSKIVILGVNHSYQLVSKECQPAAYRAFIDRVQPAGIGIERSPESFSRNDFYEFTYEQQDLIVPYAIEKGISLHPFDWNLTTEEQLLAWNIENIDSPPFMRGEDTYKDFIYFPRIEEDFFYSERPEVHDQINHWTDTPMKDENDFPRRLFLYRTYMQAMRIKNIARQYKGKTLLIIVGHMHKPDIEGLLKSKDDIEIIHPSYYGYPSELEISNHQRLNDFYAIANFNLLGVQSRHETKNKWLQEVITKLNQHSSSIETKLFTTLFNLPKYPSEKLIEIYSKLVKDITSSTNFTYTDVKFKDRIDSYFDPFGNLDLKSYLFLLIGKEYINLNNKKEALKYKNLIRNDGNLDLQQKMQFELYWEVFISNK